MGALLDRNLALRVASAVVGLPLLGAVVMWRSSWGLFGLSFAIVIGALHELTVLTMPAAARRERLATVLVGGLVHAAIFLRPGAALPALMVAMMVLGAVTLAGVRATPADAGATVDHQGAVSVLLSAIASVVYVPVLLASLPLLHRDFPYGRLWVVVAIAVTFTADTGAYFAGRTLGRHKLAPGISPGKTIEGAVGGLVAAVGFMLVARATFFPSLGVVDVAVVGIAAGVVGPIGDLVESLLKRAAGAKDSGRLIPGHGGLLDRIDAVLFVASFVYIYVAWFR